jgi:predicted DNA-binding transcriptional regulator YafY
MTRRETEANDSKPGPELFTPPAAPGPAPAGGPPGPFRTPPSALRPPVTRRAFGRLAKIFGWLQQGRYPNCRRIARDLEVSPKTATRDLDCLREEWALPIAYDVQRHGFYFTRPVERLPWVPVSEAELFAVCISSKVLALYQGLPFQKPLELAFAKLAASLEDQERYQLEHLDLAFSLRPFAPEDPDLRVLELVCRAVAESRELQFTYRKPGQPQPAPRQVQPYHVLSYEGRLYLLAHDPARGALRTFALGRMQEPQLTAQRFVRPKDFDPQQELRASLGLMQGQGDYQVVLELDPWLTDLLRGRRLHPSQHWQELPGRGSRLALRLSGLEEIEQYVLSWGPHATVLGPEELRRRLGKVAAELAARYGSG